MTRKSVLPLFFLTLVWVAGCKQHIAQPKSKEDVSPKQVEQAAATYKSDSEFLQRVAQEARGQIELAKLAQSKAQSADVKAFAGQIIKDNTSLANEVAKLGSAQNVTLPTDLDSAQQENKSKLEQKSGSDFDKAYMKEALARVQDVNKLFEGAVQKAQDQQVKDFATVNLISLRDQLDRATGTAKKVGA
jgi:putative membrane protein